MDLRSDVPGDVGERVVAGTHDDDVVAGFETVAQHDDIVLSQLDFDPANFEPVIVVGEIHTASTRVRRNNPGKAL